MDKIVRWGWWKKHANWFDQGFNSFCKAFF